MIKAEVTSNTHTHILTNNMAAAAAHVSRPMQPPCYIADNDAIELVGVPVDHVDNFIRRRPGATVCDYMQHALSLPLRPRNIISSGTYGTAVALTAADGNVRAVAKFSITTESPGRLSEPYKNVAPDDITQMNQRRAIERETAEREAKRMNDAARSLNTRVQHIVPKAIDFFFSERADNEGDADFENAVILMEYADGNAMMQELYKPGVNVIELSRKMGVEIGRALRVLHNHGMVHGDLHASNILVRPDAHAISIIDWSQMVKAGEARSPQQWARFRINDAIGPARHVFTRGGHIALAAYFEGLLQTYPDCGIEIATTGDDAPFPIRTNVVVRVDLMNSLTAEMREQIDVDVGAAHSARWCSIANDRALDEVWDAIWQEANLQTQLVERDRKAGDAARTFRAAITQGSNVLRIKSPIARLQPGARLLHPHLPRNTLVYSTEENVVRMTENALKSDGNALIKIDIARHIEPRTGREDEFLGDLQYNDELDVWYVTVALGRPAPDIHSLISAKIDGKRYVLHVDDVDDNGNLILRENVSADRRPRNNLHMWVMPYSDDQEERVRDAEELREQIRRKDEESLQFWTRMQENARAREARRTQAEIERTIEELDQLTSSERETTPIIRSISGARPTPTASLASLQRFSRAQGATAPVTDYRRAAARAQAEAEAEAEGRKRHATAAQQQQRSRARGPDAREQEDDQRAQLAADTPVPTFDAMRSRRRGGGV
jgi:hypothetical protein